MSNKGWNEPKNKVNRKGKIVAGRHSEVRTNPNTQTLSEPLKSPQKSHPYTLEEKIIEMLKENTGMSILDSGGESGRSWQINQGKDFNKEQATTYHIYKDGEVIITFNIFHYLKAYTNITPECRKLQEKFMKFAQSTGHEDESWLNSMIEFAETMYDNTPKENFLRGATNTYNHENILSQVLQYVGFSYNDKTYILLQIHGGADVRGGYTKPQVFEVPDVEYFLMAQNNVTAGDDKGHMWSSDDGGSHWQSDSDESGDLKLEEKDDKAFHKGCGSEVWFNAMESY